MAELDTIVRNGSVIVEQNDEPQPVDIGISGGRIARLESRISEGATEEIDAEGCLVVPGAVDAHFHLGIYRDLALDAWSETRAAAAGGVTSIISYFRTGAHYLGRSGSYQEIFPAALAAVEGQAHVDYGFHLAPMTQTHLSELDWLVNQMGVTSFKFFWSYVGLGVDPESESYDGAFAYALMERIAEVNAARENKTRVSLSVHCEDADLVRLFSERATAYEGTPLQRYSQGRPSLAEVVSIQKTAEMAAVTGAPVNLLHLSSADALQALRDARRRFPGHDIRGETAAHYLSLPGHLGNSQHAKVNPPIRGVDDAESLWGGVTDGDIDWLGSDHCCSLAEQKEGTVWEAVPGFGGTSLLYPYLISEGYLGGRLSLGRVVALASANPARAYGCFGAKGRIGIGADADIAIFEPSTSRFHPVHSAQDFEPYDDVTLRVRLRQTLLRGETVAHDGIPIGSATGRYLNRPLRTSGKE